ncbi:MAG: 16S rRNA (cytosine(967)-C(5))-methyltransferase RsmB [Halioglobus sp.]|nr:16S rRNA (cytosine(967)-C(5))-methyltransferase RsmB [Halioglobus sp.]
MSQDVRATAATIIAAVLDGQSLDRALGNQITRVDGSERGLLQQLCYGSLRHAPRLQALLIMLLDKPLKTKDRDLQGLLICGLYQFDHTRIPDHATVAATVNATRALRKDWARGLINAVLRRYQRERNMLIQSLSPAAMAAHPDWLFQCIHSQWPRAASSIIDSNNQQAPMTLRVNRRKVSREDYLSSLSAQGIAASAGALTPDSLQLTQPMDVDDLPGFAAGQVSVQDEAAQLAAIMLSARPGERVLDACAAPGGKCCHILEIMPGLSELVAMDVNASRLTRVRDNLTRLGLSATVLQGDAASPPNTLQPASFDRILLDAPCSASGVIRRHPDIKLLRRERDLRPLAQHQLRLLHGLWPLLKPGGSLLYATCSVLDAENSQVVHRFLDGQDAAIHSVPSASGGEIVSGGRQLLPTAAGPDGLFYARFKKAA